MLLLAITSVFLLAFAAAAAQDFQKSYSIPAGGEVAINSASGDVNVVGYNGNTVVVTAYKEGRDRNLVDIEDLSSGNRVELRSRYPRDCRCDASVRFEVQVPAMVDLKENLSTASGNIHVAMLTGEVNAKSASGEITVRKVNGAVKAHTASGNVEITDVAGTVSAHTASGNVDASLTRIEGNNSMEFTTASGNVTVKAPANLDANVEMTTHSGSVRTDFPLSITDRDDGRNRFGPRTMGGRLGQGSRELRIRSASGNVKLLRN
jgi:hypothetical protein